LKAETYDFYVSFLVSMFHSKKTLWERFKNTVGAIQKHNGSDSKTQRKRETSPIVFLFFCVKLIPYSYKGVFSL
uniref:hypothetical protein n=1 Tax=Alloprevotella sp. TaxID=1872471 RepID=UPI003FD88F64